MTLIPEKKEFILPPEKKEFILPKIRGRDVAADFNKARRELMSGPSFIEELERNPVPIDLSIYCRICDMTYPADHEHSEDECVVHRIMES